MISAALRYRRGRLATLAVLALTMLTSFGAVACGDDDDGDAGASTTGTQSEKKDVKVAFLAVTTANTFTQAAVNAAKAEAEKLGVEIEVLDARFEPPRQLAQCQDLLARGDVDAIVVLPSAGPPMVPCASEAKGKGVPVVSHNNPIGDDLTTNEPTVPGVTAQVMIPLDEALGAIADEVAKACEGRDPCNVAWLRTTKFLPQPDALLEQELNRIAEENPNIKIAADADGCCDVETGIKAMQDMLQAEPNPDVVVSYAAQGMEGAEKALRSAGKKPGDELRLVTTGGTQLFVDKIRSGDVYSTLLVLPSTEAATAVDIAVKAARGEDFGPAGVNPLDVADLPAIIDQDNKNDYPDFKGEWER